MENDDRNPARDRELGMDRPIARRDFLNGIAIGVGGAIAGRMLPGLPGFDVAAAAAAAPQDQPGYNPPALTKMRGTHEGTYDIAHALKDGTYWKTAPRPIATGETYDLVVVGAGISGLAAAYHYRARTSPSARILILDPHDDVGGHAQRNEFQPGGKLWIGTGGTLLISSPFPYSKEAHALMDAIGVDPVALSAEANKAADRSVFNGLQSAFFFDKETFGEDRLVIGSPGSKQGPTWPEFLAKTPLSPRVQRDILWLETAKIDYMPGLTSDQKKDRLSRISYKDFLLNYAKVDPGVLPFYQARTHGLYGVGIDAVGALECWAQPSSSSTGEGHYPGFEGLNLDPKASGRMSYTSRGQAIPQPEYTFHFPDGSATLARLLVRALIPDALPGHTAQDSVLAKLDYAKLDQRKGPIRVRLGTTAARVRHVGSVKGAKQVEVTYGREKKLYTVRAKAVVLACWNMMIPFLCEELPQEQKDALRYGVKVPLVYTNVSLTNWRPFKKLGINSISTPGMYHVTVRLDIPTVIGGYNPMPKSPDDPMLVRMARYPCHPGLPVREQQRIGHMELLSTPFETFERNIRDQMTRILSAGGFDPARDIDAITVNRWPHGYAYEYSPLWDPDWPPGQSPCEIGRKQFGRITVANSDAAAAAYTDVAIDQAYRAVDELIASKATT